MERLVSVFREIRRVLTDDGTVWLNLGDCYCHGESTAVRGNGRAAWARNKQLALVPFRVAMSLQEDGWLLRNTVVWHKPNAMPASVRDRLASTWEPFFLLSKAEQYYFNLDGIQDNGEHVLFISTADSLSILNASQKLQGDERFVLGRDVVATWLNYLEGNGIGTAADLNSPRHYIDDSAQWLDLTTNGDHTLTVAELSTGKVAASSPIWQSPAFGLDLSGSQLHSGLDEYNNHGTILGVHYASTP